MVRDADRYEDFERVVELRKRALLLDERTFVTNYDSFALLVIPPDGTAGRKATVQGPTQLEESYRATILVEDSVEVDPAMVAAFLERVAFVRKRPGNPFPNMISIGRARNSDLMLMLPSISKLHGYFLADGDGWSLTDWNSTNGCTLNGERLAPRAPRKLDDDDVIGLGLEFRARYLTPSHLFSVLTQTATTL